jgi:hypothetical protein
LRAACFIAGKNQSGKEKAELLDSFLAEEAPGNPANLMRTDKSRGFPPIGYPMFGISIISYNLIILFKFCQALATIALRCTYPGATSIAAAYPGNSSFEGPSRTPHMPPRSDRKNCPGIVRRTR